MIRSEHKHEKTKARKIKQYVNQNTVEAPIGVSSFVSDALEQIGIEKHKNQEKKGGDLLEGQELSLSDIKSMRKQEEQKEEIARFLDIDPGLDYKREVLGGENQMRESAELSRTLDQILFELKQLAASSKELQTQFKEVVVEQRIEKPGKYHLTFFSFILTLIRDAKEKIEDSSVWLTASKGKAEKKGYWGMFKKHGTSFGLSNERAVATQVG